MLHQFRFVATLILATVISLSVARADDWPNKPVKMIVLSGPGGAPDIMARLISEQLSRKFGKNFYVENAVGAGGITGMRALKTSAPVFNYPQIFLRPWRPARCR